MRPLGCTTGEAPLRWPLTLWEATKTQPQRVVMAHLRATWRGIEAFTWSEFMRDAWKIGDHSTLDLSCILAG